MEPVAMVTYNLLVRNVQAVILLENEIQTPADTTIFKSFQNTSCMVSNIMINIRKPTD